MKIASSRWTFRLGIVGAVALAFSASAYAYVCHPDLPGTRNLPVKGRVDRERRLRRAPAGRQVRARRRQAARRPPADRRRGNGLPGRPLQAPERATHAAEIPAAVDSEAYPAAVRPAPRALPDRRLLAR